MRITHNMMYTGMVHDMNNSLSEYVKYNEQNATQKHLNRPSDDPIGIVRVMNYRASLDITEQYVSNSNDAKSWLTSTDSALQLTQTSLSTIREKALLAADGKMTADNRFQVASELREIQAHLMNVANTAFNDQHLFGGQKTSEPPFSLGLGVTTRDPDLAGKAWEVTGKADRSIIVHFPNNPAIIPPTTIAGTTNANGNIGANMDYKFSLDGGKTWQTKTLAANNSTLDFGNGVTLKLPPNTTLKATPNNNDPKLNDTSSALVIRPTAYYHGDDDDNTPKVDIYGSSQIDTARTKALGIFASDVRIRIDEEIDIDAGGTYDYSYSDDHGATWTPATATVSPGDTSVRLVVTGGYLDVTTNDPLTEKILNGQEFIVRPHRAADLGFEIASNDFITVSQAGSSIFGGLSPAKAGDLPTADPVGVENMFEVVSDLIAFCEVNNQDGVSQSVEDLRITSEHLVTNLATLGGKINRVSLNSQMLALHSDDMVERKSKIEDADLTELLINLSQSKVAYESILQSSSLIMNINLLRFM